MHKEIIFPDEPFEIDGLWYIEGKELKEQKILIALQIPAAYVPLMKLAKRQESSLRRGIRNELRTLSHSLIPTMVDPVLIVYNFLREKALCELQLRGRRIANCEPWYAVMMSILWEKPLLCDEEILRQQELERDILTNYQTHSLQLALRLLDTDTPTGAQKEATIYRELGRRKKLSSIFRQLENR